MVARVTHEHMIAALERVIAELTGPDGRGFSRHGSLAITHLEDAVSRIRADRRAREAEEPRPSGNCRACGAAIVPGQRTLCPDCATGEWRGVELPAAVVEVDPDLVPTARDEACGDSFQATAESDRYACTLAPGHGGLHHDVLADAKWSGGSVAV